MKILNRARLTVAVVGAAGVASLGLFVGQAANAQRASTTGGDSTSDGTPGSATANQAPKSSTGGARRSGKVSNQSGSSGNGGSHGS